MLEQVLQDQAVTPDPDTAQAQQIVPANPYYLSFAAEITPFTAQSLIGAVGAQVNAGYNEVHLLLSTPGGQVADGLSIYNVLRALPVRVVTYNVGTVNSIGNVIFLAGAKRFASPTSSFMFHGVAANFAQQASLEEKQLKERLQSVQNDQKLIADIIVRHSNMPLADVEKLFLETAFVTPDDAKRRGLIDDVINVQVPAGALFHQLVFQK